MILFGFGVIMGFFNDDTDKEERKRQERRRALEKYDIFKGVECEVILPEKQLKISGSSGAKKGVATLAFGIIGWAATSGTSQNEENRIITAIFHVVDKGVVFKNGAIDGSDIRIPYEDIISVEIFVDENHKPMSLLTLLGNRKIFFFPTCGFYNGKYVLDYTINVLNERISGSLYEEDGWGLEIDYNQLKKLDAQRKIDNLERLCNMQKNGLISEERFTKLKEIMEEEEDTIKNCKNCGVELADDSKFCDECGTKVE